MFSDLELKDNADSRVSICSYCGVKRPLLLCNAPTNFESRMFFKCKPDFTTFLTIQGLPISLRIKFLKFQIPSSGSCQILNFLMCHSPTSHSTAYLVILLS